MAGRGRRRSFGVLLGLVLRLYPPAFRRWHGDDWRRFVMAQREERRYRSVGLGPVRI